MNTWYVYLLPRNGNVYLGMKTGSDERAWKWDMPLEDALARLRRGFKYVRTNYDDFRTVHDKKMQDNDCRFLAVNRWRKDMNLGPLTIQRGGR